MQQQNAGANLVAMANQIGDFFRFQGDEASAMKSVAAHLNHFWAPSMRRDLVQWLDDHHGDGMTPLTKASVQTYRRQLVDPRAQVAGEDRIDEPKGGGDAG